MCVKSQCYGTYFSHQYFQSLEYLHVKIFCKIPGGGIGIQEIEIVETILDPSGFLTQVKSIVIALPINVDCRLVSQTYFGQGNPNFNADDSATSISEAQIVQNLDE